MIERTLKGFHAEPWIDRLFIAYLYWVAFEWTLLSGLNNYVLIQSIRNAIDVIPIVLITLSFVILNPRLRSFDIKILFGFALIILISSLSLALEHTAVASVADYIGVTVRFVPLIILVRYTSEDFQARLFSHVRIVYWMLVALAVISLAGKEWFTGLFLPPAEVFGDVLPTTYKDPGISASFINTVEFSFFLLALTIIYLNGSGSPATRLAVSIVSLVLIILSYSIASVLGLFLVFFIRSKHKALVVSLFAGLMIAGIWFFNDFIVLLLGMDVRYWIEISSEFNRLGYITKVFPEFLHGNFKDILLGMGYNADLVDFKLANYHNTPFVMINNENNLKYLKDVYWLSILIAQGIIALLTTFYIYFTVWTGSRKTGSAESYRIVKSFIIIALFMGLFNQIMDMKAFTYCFWLMAGLALYKPAVQPVTVLA